VGEVFPNTLGQGASIDKSNRFLIRLFPKNHIFLNYLSSKEKFNG
jgi:hypothetical protein